MDTDVHKDTQTHTHRKTHKDMNTHTQGTHTDTGMRTSDISLGNTGWLYQPSHPSRYPTSTYPKVTRALFLPELIQKSVGRGSLVHCPSRPPATQHSSCLLLDCFHFPTLLTSPQFSPLSPSERPQGCLTSKVHILSPSLDVHPITHILASHPPWPWRGLGSALRMVADFSLSTILKGLLGHLIFR